MCLFFCGLGSDLQYRWAGENRTNNVNNSTCQGSMTYKLMWLNMSDDWCWKLKSMSVFVCACMRACVCVCVCVCVQACVKLRREWHNVLLNYDMSTCRDTVSSETHNHYPRTTGCDITGRALLLSPWLHFQNGQFRFQLLTTYVLISLRLWASNHVIHLFVVLIGVKVSWCEPRGLASIFDPI